MSPLRPAPLALALVATLLLGAALLPAVRGAPYGQVATPLHDFDGAWHLACGRLIVESGEVPRADPLCFTSDGLDWINLNWLSQVALYRAFLWRGFEGPVALAALCLAATFALTTLAARARGGAAALLPLAWLALWMTVARSHSIRPQTVSFTLLALCAWLLAPAELSRGRAAALLATLLAWSHLHGGFVFGLALLGLDAVGACVDARGLPPRARWLLGVLLLTVLGFALHPHGFAALGYALTYTRALGAQLESVPELMPLPPRSTLGLATLAWFGLGAVGIYRARSTARTGDLLTALFFFALTWKMRRAVVPFAIVSAPLVVAAWSKLLEERLAPLEAHAAPAARALPPMLAALALLFALFTLALAVPGRPGQVASPPFPLGAPTRAVEALRGREGRIFGRYSDGGLLVWALYPARRTFIDGRGDLHARGRAYADYETIAHQRPGWTELLDLWKVDLVLLGNAAPPLVALEREHGWRRIIDLDGFAVVARPLTGSR